MSTSGVARGEPAPEWMEARTLWRTGKYDEAADAYQALLKTEPVAAAIGLARVHASRGELEKAEQALAAPLALPDADARPELAEAFAEAASVALARGDWQGADERIALALKVAPNDLRARWLQAERHRLSGRLKEAGEGYHWFVDHYNVNDVTDPDELRCVALAAAQYARWNKLSDQFGFIVNDLMPAIIEDHSDEWPAHYESGRLFAEKFNQPEAARSFAAALKINPRAAEVHAALASLAMQNLNLEEARNSVERALAINPNCVEALRAQADTHLANFELDDAIQTLEAARKLNPLASETLGRLAGAYGVKDGHGNDAAGTRLREMVEQVNARNPHDGEFYSALGAALDLTRKFPSAARYYEEAVQRMPQLPAPQAELGLLQMRLGNEAEARKLLEASFEADPFNVRVSNTIKVLEVLDTYAVLETEHFVIKFDRGQDEMLAQAVARYLEDEVYPELTEQFQFEPEGKSLFEIFNRARNTGGHGWFSARMVGLPYVGTVGACAGKMVAMVSPASMEQKFNWARVVKHEFVHVLNLQQTNFNIPHWFTEALATEAENIPRPPAWNEMLRRRVSQGEMFDLETINLGFARPQSQEDWSMAYCQAQLYAQYMTERYGADATAKMLAAYRDNLSTRDALQRCFRVSLEGFERGYLEHVRALVKELSGAEAQAPPKRSPAEWERALTESPNDPDIAAQVARACFARRDYPRARKLAEQALTGKPAHPTASCVLADVYRLVGEDAKAEELLRAALDEDSPNADVVDALAPLLLANKEHERAAKLYQKLAAARPFDMTPLKKLAAIYLQAGQMEPLVDVLTKLAESDGDNVLYRKKLAQLARERKDWAALGRWSEEILQIDILDASAHALLAESFEHRHDETRAKQEREAARRLDPSVLDRP